MPNDVQDWTALQQVNLISQSKQLEGDLGSLALNADSGTATISPNGPTVNGGGGVLASFKAAAGAVIALVGNLGAVSVGSVTSIQPAFGQATVATHLLLAWVTGPFQSSSVSVGWSKVLDFQGAAGGWSALWAKPNCGSGETAPTFTFSAFSAANPVTAQLAEFSGVATASPTEQTGSASTTTGGLTVSAGAADAALGDLIAMASRFGIAGFSTATFSQSMNNATVVHAGDSGTTVATSFGSHDFGIVSTAGNVIPLGVQPWPVDSSGLSAPVAGSAPSVVLAATPGKAYTATEWDASLVATAATADRQYVELLDGAVIIWQHILGVDAVIDRANQVTVQGRARKGTVGNSMTLKLAAIGASSIGTCDLGAYLR